MIETSRTNPKATWLLLLLLLLLLFARLAFAFSKFAVQRHQLGRLALRRRFDVGQGGWNVSQVANEGPDQTHADGLLCAVAIDDTSLCKQYSLRCTGAIVSLYTIQSSVAIVSL